MFQTKRGYRAEILRGSLVVLLTIPGLALTTVGFACGVALQNRL
jgi:hypothetical protein